MVLSRAFAAQFRRFGWLAMLWLLGASASAQITSTKGREFWLAFQHNNLSGTLPTQVLRRIYISSERTTRYTIRNRFGTETTGTISAGTTVAIDVDLGADATTDAEVETSGLIERNKAYYIRTEDSVSVFLLNWEVNSSDATVVLPVHNLGNDYYVLSMPTQISLTAIPVAQPSQALILATDNDTEVEIIPRGATTGTVVRLQQGEVYQVQDRNFQGDLTGTRIRGTGNCRRFAVFAGIGARALCPGLDTTLAGPALEAQLGVANSTDCSGSNHMVEQMPPVPTWGQNFLVVPLRIRETNYVRILASQPNTQVRVNGVLRRTLQAGQFHSILLSAPTRIETSQPALVAQFCQSLTVDRPDEEKATGDPFMILVSPLEQTINEVTFDAFAPTNPATGVVVPMRFFANIVTRTANVGLVQRNGVPLGAAAFTPAPTLPDFAYAQVEVSAGTQTIRSDSNIVVYVYALGDNRVDSFTFEGYGYSGGSRLENLALRIATDLPLPICSGLPNTYTAETTIPTDGFRWDFGNGEVRTGQSVSYAYPFAGTYTLTLTAQRTASCAVDTIRRTLTVTGERLLRNNDTTICRNDVIALQTRPASATFSWAAAAGTLSATSGANVTYRATTAGRHRITLTSRFPDGCIYTDTMAVNVTVPGVIRSPRADTSVCPATVLTLTSDVPGLWRLRRGGVTTVLVPSAAAVTVAFPRIGTDTLELLVGGCVTRRRVTVFAPATISSPTTAPSFAACQGQVIPFTATRAGTWFRRRGSAVTQLAVNVDRIPAQRFDLLGTEFLIVESCGVRDSVAITVQARPVITPNLADTTFCAGDIIRVRSNLAATWRVRLPDGTTQNLLGGGASTSSGNVTVPLGTTLLIARANGCEDTIRAITVREPPRFVNLGSDTTVCFGARLTLRSTDIGYWYRKRGSRLELLDSLVSQVRDIPFDVAGTDSLLLVNCTVIERRAVTVLAPLELNPQVSPDVCNLSRGKVLLAVTGGRAPYTYAWNGTALTTLGPTNRANAVRLRAGTATVRVRDAVGCELTANFAIANLDPPTLDVTSEPVLPAVRILPDAPLRATGTSDRGIAWTWTLGDGSTRTTPTIDYTYTEPNTPPDAYSVTVQVADTAGCTAELALGTYQVLGSPPLQIPNVFTPNQDGVNDEFTVRSIAEAIAQFRLWIYDRSGRLVFQSTQLAPGWRGQSTGGGEVAAGVYFYRIEATFINGQRQERTGSVTLLR